MATIYKIRSKKTGLFSKGGSTPSFSKKGKIWNGIGPLKLHFNQFIGRGYIGRGYYEDCEVVEYELVEAEVAVSDCSEWMEASKERQEQREMERKIRAQQWRVAQEMKELERLRKKFGV